MPGRGGNHRRNIRHVVQLFEQRAQLPGDFTWPSSDELRLSLASSSLLSPADHDGVAPLVLKSASSAHHRTMRRKKWSA